MTGFKATVSASTGDNLHNCAPLDLPDGDIIKKAHIITKKAHSITTICVKHKGES